MYIRHIHHVTVLFSVGLKMVNFAAHRHILGTVGGVVR